MIEYNDETAKKLPSNPPYPNDLTAHSEYECPCGKGKIIYEHVVGFCDTCAWIECDVCKKRYNVVLGCGHFWELREK